jgi:hypothetical protein
MSQTIKNIVLAGATALTLVSSPMIAHAQGLVGGVEEGAHRGNRAAGPVGAVVGGVIGGGVGTVNGALGTHHHHRCYWHHGHRHCRY